MEYIEMIVDVVKTLLEQWDGIEDVVLRLIDFAETVGTTLIG